MCTNPHQLPPHARFFDNRGQKFKAFQAKEPSSDAGGSPGKVWNEKQLFFSREGGREGGREEAESAPPLVWRKAKAPRTVDWGFLNEGALISWDRVASPSGARWYRGSSFSHTCSAGTGGGGGHQQLAPGGEPASPPRTSTNSSVEMRALLKEGDTCWNRSPVRHIGSQSSCGQQAAVARPRKGAKQKLVARSKKNKLKRSM